MPESGSTATRRSKFLRRFSLGAHCNFPLPQRSPTFVNRDQCAGPEVLRRRWSESIRDSEDSLSHVSSNLDILKGESISSQRGNGVSHDLLGEELNEVKDSYSLDHEDAVMNLNTLTGWTNKLSKGTFLTRITKSRRKVLHFRIDFEAAKLCWEPAGRTNQLYIDDIREIRVGDLARHDSEEFPISNEQLERRFAIIYSDPNKYNGRNTKSLHLIADNSYTFQMWTEALETVSRGRIEIMTGLMNASTRSLLMLWRQFMIKEFGVGSIKEKERRIDFTHMKKICRSLHIYCSEVYLRDVFNWVDESSCGWIDFPQFQRFVERLQEQEEVREIFCRYLTKNEVRMSYEDFRRFLIDSQKVCVWENEEHWKIVFRRFAQVDESGIDRVKRLKRNELIKSNHFIKDDCKSTLSFKGFQSFLTSSTNTVLTSSPVNFRLDRPLNEYFVSSSHNTYLLGHQLVGESSSEGYIFALKRGCRCIEIDCWDGSDGRPVVTHGRTGTSVVLFSKCISVITHYAFKASDYPLIISLEVHCCHEQQIIMSRIIREKFGSRLVTEPLATTTAMNCLPSPEELKGRVLIKVKFPGTNSPVSLIENLDKKSKFGGAFSNDTPSENISNIGFHGPLISTPGNPLSDSNILPYDWSDPQVNSRINDNNSVKPGNISKSLGDLGVYTRGFKFQGFKSSVCQTFNHVFSIGEARFNLMCRNKSPTKIDVERHNMRYLMRVYPHGLRVASGNFDPLKVWRRGVQMVALNWQTNDINLQINHAMFSGFTDSTGYVLKPLEMRPRNYHTSDVDNQSFANTSNTVYPYTKTRKALNLTVKIISARQLPRPSGPVSQADVTQINPYVELEIHTAEDKVRNFLSTDCLVDPSVSLPSTSSPSSVSSSSPSPSPSSPSLSSCSSSSSLSSTSLSANSSSNRINTMSSAANFQRKRTKIVENNGYNPVYNEGIRVDLKTKYPELVFLRWTVWHSPDARSFGGSVLLATFTAKLDNLQQGYRYLPLYDTNGEQYLFSSLLVKITKEDGSGYTFHQSSNDSSSKMKSCNTYPVLSHAGSLPPPSPPSSSSPPPPLPPLQSKPQSPPLPLLSSLSLPSSSTKLTSTSSSTLSFTNHKSTTSSPPSLSLLTSPTSPSVCENRSSSRLQVNPAKMVSNFILRQRFKPS